MRTPAQRRALSPYRAFLLGSLAILLGWAAIARAEEPAHRYTVAAQPLSGALTEFADQADLKLMFPAELARGITSPGVTGTLTRDQALARLLTGTGMSYRFTSPDTVTIERPDPLKDLVNEAKQPLRVVENEATQAAPKKTGPDEPAALEEMTVTASPLDETSYNVLNATTATKTDTPIFDTPLSIQVVPQQVLKDQQAVRLQDALKNVSGVQFTPGGGNSGDIFSHSRFSIGLQCSTIPKRQTVHRIF
jgi:iron complex outermembrane recepter protein